MDMNFHINICYNMPKRELQIPTDKLLDGSIKDEEIILRSPSTIPDKGLRDLLATKKILGSNCSYYDIAPTEIQAIKRYNTNFDPPLTLFAGEGGILTNFTTADGELLDRPSPYHADILSQFDLKMGEINE